MKVIFSHGKESGPKGGKIRALAALATDLGCTYESLDYRDLPDHPDKRVGRLLEYIAASDDDILLVGSSMGGYVSLAAACELAENNDDFRQRIKGLFLMVPAVYLPGYQRQNFNVELPKMCIVHAWGDDVVFYQNSLRLAAQHEADYHLFAGGHRLSEALPQVKQVFSGFLQVLL